uniref:UDP-N-acetylenolpyruvoylglucosamine reductase n=1 Tax=Shewanella putrefaciens (strain 200) TaxID=399804 RepID=E6XG28_SHEP2
MIERFNVQMKKYNTLKLASVATKFFEIFDENELYELFDKKIFVKDCYRVLGEGSNLWISSKEIPVVIKLNLKGKLIDRQKEYTLVSAKAGENWSDFVEMLISYNIGGFESLVDIPGTVGAAPIQNIGAYGVEVCECISHVKVYDTKINDFRNISNKDCFFGYRDSLFKADKTLIVTEVFFEFKNKYLPNITNKEILKEMEGGEMTLQSILESVRKVRRRKLPDPNIFPNSGSFFKNPILNKKSLNKIRSVNSEVVVYEVKDGYKVSAAWLIEFSGWKGLKINDVGMSSLHSLVLVNYSESNLVSIDEFVEHLMEDVFTKFGVLLEVEPVRW